MGNEVEFSAKKEDCQVSRVLVYLMLNGSVTHTEFEEWTELTFRQKCTVLRSRIPKIKQMGWPIRPDYTEGHARYFIDFEKLAQLACVEIRDVKDAARAWMAKSFFFYRAETFIQFTRQNFRRPDAVPRQTYLEGFEFFKDKFSKPQKPGETNA